MAPHNSYNCVNSAHCVDITHTKDYKYYHTNTQELKEQPQCNADFVNSGIT